MLSYHLEKLPNGELYVVSKFSIKSFHSLGFHLLEKTGVLKIITSVHQKITNMHFIKQVSFLHQPGDFVCSISFHCLSLRKLSLSSIAGILDCLILLEVCLVHWGCLTYWSQPNCRLVASWSYLWQLTVSLGTSKCSLRHENHLWLRTHWLKIIQYFIALKISPQLHLPPP